MKNAQKPHRSKRTDRTSPKPRKSAVHPSLTTLLFPFVTNMAGMDTGIAIINPTAEPFADDPQTGSCAIHFFGNCIGGGAPATQVTPPVLPGGHVAFTLSGGGVGVPGGPSFQGYLVVECRFKNARGFAMMVRMGEPDKLGGCYLAEVIPNRDGA